MCQKVDFGNTAVNIILVINLLEQESVASTWQDSVLNASLGPDTLGAFISKYSGHKHVVL
jgi:hypothetical protein